MGTPNEAGKEMRHLGLNPRMIHFVKRVVTTKTSCQCGRGLNYLPQIGEIDNGLL